MTYRERREAKAAKLAEWGAKRQDKAEALRKVDEHLRHDWAFITQPGIGRLPIAKRMRERDEKAYELSTTGAKMRSRGAGIEDQLERAIYSDDHNAVEALEERIAGLVAQQDRLKSFNAAVRKAKGDRALIAAAMEAHLSEGERKSFLSLLGERAASYQKPELKGFPAYVLTNLGGNIRRNKERLEQIKRQAAPSFQEQPRGLTVKYGGVCRDCGAKIDRGTFALYYKQAKELACYGDHAAPLDNPMRSV